MMHGCSRYEPLILARSYFSIVWQLLENLSQAPYAVLSKNLRVALATVLFKYVDVALFLWFNRLFLSVSCLGLSSPLAAPLRDQHLRLTLGVSFRTT